MNTDSPEYLRRVRTTRQRFEALVIATLLLVGISALYATRNVPDDVPSYPLQDGQPYVEVRYVAGARIQCPPGFPYIGEYTAATMTYRCWKKEADNAHDPR